MSSEDEGNTSQSENDLNKEADNEDGVLSAEDTGNAEGTIVNEDREESASEIGGARRKAVREIVSPLKSREEILHYQSKCRRVDECLSQIRSSR